MTRIGAKDSQALLRHLATSGERLFKTSDAQEAASVVGIPSAKIPDLLRRLAQQGWLEPVQRGVFTLAPELTAVPLHEHELAMKLARPAAISHWSALMVHDLTDQLPRTTYVSTVKGAVTQASRHVHGFDFLFIQFTPERFFGVETTWSGDSQIQVTNLERTVIDAISRPKYCGDLVVAQLAVFAAGSRLNVERIVDYALKLDAATCKRLGWHLGRYGIDEILLHKLREVPVRGYVRLDPGGPKRGHCNGKWSIQENVPEGLLR